MSKMYFKNVLIADTVKKTAKYQRFEKGLNVVTSHDNHVGKSSLLKSLYYTLGAEISFDTSWDKNTKLYIVTIDVDGVEYQVARFQKNFAVLKDGKIILLTNSVSKELAKKLEEIFSFSIYLPGKNSKKVELTPPALSYMPYYIDQDTGWKELYSSFLNLDQYKKPDRIKSLYYHLQIYTKDTVQKMAVRDEYKKAIERLKTTESEIRITYQALNAEVQNLIEVDSVEAFEERMTIPKEQISELVESIGKVRNEIQEIESLIHQNEHQLQVIQEYKKIKKDKQDTPQMLTSCPKCGYNFEQELYDIVRANYNISNEEYMLQQIQYVIDSLKEKLDVREQYYIELSQQLKQIECAFDEEQDSYSVYVRQKGLKESLENFSKKLKDNIFEQHEKDAEIKKINSELRKLPNKKEIEEKYIAYVRLNIMGLGAWDSSYEGKIKLLKPIKAQGSLVSKIILAQYIGLFQTMDYFKCDAMRFPFVIDSPRGNEASDASSKDILEMIEKLESLEQIILATVDYDKFETDKSKVANLTKLDNPRHLLNESDYASHEEIIRDIYEVLQTIK